MSKQKSSISGGGSQTTETVGNATISTTQDKNGNITAAVKTDHNGDQWSLNSIGKTTEWLGNDGRNE